MTLSRRGCPTVRRLRPLAFLIAAACQPERPFHSLVDVDVQKVRQDEDYRAALVSVAEDRDDRNWRIAAGLLIEADRGGPARADVLPALEARWDDSTAHGVPDVPVWTYVVQACHELYGCGAEGGRCPADAPPLCAKPDPAWMGCPGHRPEPMPCFRANPGWSSDGWTAGFPDVVPAAP